MDSEPATKCFLVLDNYPLNNYSIPVTRVYIELTVNFQGWSQRQPHNHNIPHVHGYPVHKILQGIMYCHRRLGRTSAPLLTLRWKYRYW